MPPPPVEPHEHGREVLVNKNKLDELKQNPGNDGIVASPATVATATETNTREQMCRSTVENAHTVVDDRGNVCIGRCLTLKRLLSSNVTGISEICDARSGTKDVCDSKTKCCTSYESCISCCIEH